jgi:hypothetical protein
MNSNVNKLDTVSKLLIISGVLITLLNAYLHDPYVGYDAGDYASYIDSLSEGQLPGWEDSDEFFTPPLPFVLPALIKFILRIPILPTLKVAQFFNVLLAFASALILARICNRFSEGNQVCRNLALVFLLMLPVFYKTHAFVRAEPYLLVFILLYVELLIRLANERFNPYGFSIQSGLVFGAIVLSRQWGILILPAVFVYAIILVLKDRTRRSSLIKGFILSGLIAFVVSGWFYFSLFDRFGSVTAFNREPAEQFRLKNKPASFYIGTGNSKLFSDPVRDSFDNQLIPILYTETWGDYWVFFQVYGQDLRSGKYLQNGLLPKAINEQGSEAWLETNRYDVSPYLGRVNLVSVLPTSIAALGAIWVFVFVLRNTFSSDKETNYLPVLLILMIIPSTMVGYLWFLIQYPTLDGDTIKATYVLQIFPFIGILLGLFGERINRKHMWFYPAILLIFLLVFIHNLPATLTNY